MHAEIRAAASSTERRHTLGNAHESVAFGAEFPTTDNFRETKGGYACIF